MRSATPVLPTSDRGVSSRMAKQVETVEASFVPSAMFYQLRALAAFLFLLFAADAHAQPQLDRISIVKFGIYTNDVQKEHRDGQGVLQRDVVNSRLALATTTIPAQLGVTFGVEYQLIGQPTGSSVSIQAIIRFPPSGARPVAGGLPIHFSQAERMRNLNSSSLEFWSFSEPWELVPGMWAIEFWHEGRKFAEQKFDVVPP